MTPARLMSESKNSVRRRYHNRTVPGTSESSMPAVMTIAASTEMGSVERSHGNATSITPSATPAMTPASGDFAPADLLIAERV